MASDSMLRSFSLFFEFEWPKSNILSPSEVTEFCRNKRLTEANSEEIFGLLQAFLTVRNFYGCIFRNCINNDKTKYRKVDEERCDYIKRICNDERWFGRPTIFERCFATISFILTCLEYTDEVSSDRRRVAYILWSKYFDEYAKEFYTKGGWKRFRRIADSYAKVTDFISIVNPKQDSIDFINLYKSVENYMYFRTIRRLILQKEYETKIINRMKTQYKTGTVLWIKFIVQNGNAESFTASCPKSPSEVTCLLRALRCYCKPYGFKVRQSKLSSDPSRPQKPINVTICSSGRNRESYTKKELDGKREPQTTNAHKNFYFKEATGQESSNSIIKNVSLHNTTIEKVYEVKDTKNKNFTGGGTERTDNMAYTSSTPGESWNKGKGKKNSKKDGLQVSHESLQLGKEMKQASSNSSNSFPRQNTAIEKDFKDISKKNYKSENDRTGYVPYSSSTGGKKWKKGKGKWNWKKDGLEVSNKSLQLGKERKQASLNSSNN